MVRTRARRWAWLLGVALLATMLVLPACGEDEEDGVGEGTPEATEVADETPGDAEETPGVVEEVPGVTDTEILLGSHLPLSGLAAAWGVPLKAGMDAYFESINDQGGVHGRTIKLIVYDSEYTGPTASEVTRRLVEQDEVFGIMGALGTAAHSAVWKYLEEKGVPDMFILTGNTKWTEPVVKSRFPILVDYLTEGRMLGEYIAENFPGKKLGIIAQNDDFGKEGEEGLRLGVEDADMEIVVEYYEETQSDLTAQVQRLRNENVDVLAAYTMPPQAGSMIKAARETLSWDVPILLTGVNAVEVVAALAGLDNIEGTVSVVFAYQAFQTEEPGIAAHHEMMAEYAPDVEVGNLTMLGAAIGEAMVHIFEENGPDLTRESFLDTAESICGWVCSTCMVPMNLSPTDHRPTEIEVYIRATVDRSTDPPTFRWEPFGDPISFESTEECPE
jgi:branched-chain amino acid transport system substrate-binding protein